MGFMNSYKRLDNLCRDINGIGVTGYIEDMKCKINGAYHVPGWKKDYFQLKHYRYIRNQIAHENYADEKDMCSEKDELWLKDFYHRIMTQRDPLALYYKATKSHTASKTAVSEVFKSPQYVPAYSDTNKPGRKFVTAAVLFVIAAAAFLLFVLFS